jgi:tetratricopeptide (TPR) repeat protein
MRAILFTSAIRSDKPFLLALSFVALFGVVELGAVAVHYAAQVHAISRSAQPGVTALSAQAPGAERSVAAAPTSPQSAIGTTEATTPSPAAAHLLQEASRLRERGDTTNALARLQEALQLEPKNANVLTEMAMIYESIKLFDRSNETWRRVQDIGPAAGPLYELADLKLKMGVAAASTSPSSTSAPVFNTDGIPENSTFGITEVTATQANDPEMDMHLTLRVAVKAREGAPFDFTRVKILVLFYDTVDNDRIVLTDADVSYEWLTPHHDWADTNPEVLAITYLRPKKGGSLSSDATLSAAAAAVVPPVPGKKSRSGKADPPPPAESGESGQHKYLGYIVRVYYRDQLQAVRADPSKLLSLFPPPFTIPAQ